MVTALDAAIGRIVQTLEDTKMMDNTLIVFTTDNGGNVLAGGNKVLTSDLPDKRFDYSLIHYIRTLFGKAAPEVQPLSLDPCWPIRQLSARFVACWIKS